MRFPAVSNNRSASQCGLPDATILTILSGFIRFVCYKFNDKVNAGKLTGRPADIPDKNIWSENTMLGYYNGSGKKPQFATRLLNKYRRFRQQNKPYYPSIFFALDAALIGLKVMPVAIAFIVIYIQVS